MSATQLAAVFAVLADAALKGTIILLAALAATHLMRRRSAAARHLAWAVALASMLALPLVTRFLPAWRVVPVPAPLRPATEFVAATPAVSPPETRSPSATPIAANVPTPAAGTASAPVAASPSPAKPFDWKRVMTMLWLAGGLLLVVRLGYGIARVWWMERRATEITDEAWVRIADGLARRLRVGRLVTLLRETNALVPMTWGIVRPVVLLPADAEGWDDERRTVVLAHELAHVRRWDPATQWIAHLAIALFWFHPLVWLAARRMREEREHACDDAVLSLGTRPVAYADHLLEIVRSLGRAEGPAAALAMARRSQFEGRLLAILDAATPRGGVSRGLGFAALIVAAAAVAPLAALRATPPPAAAIQAAPPEDVTTLTVRIAGIDDPAPRNGGIAGKLRESAASVRRSAAKALGLGGPKPAEQPAPPIAAAPTPAAAAQVATSLVGADRQALMARLDTADPGLYAAIIRAADEIQSSTDRRIILTQLLEKHDLGTDNVTAIIRSAKTIDSDTERRLVLDAAIHHRAFASNPVPHVFYEALAAFTSSTEERLVMSSLLETRRLNADCLTLLFGELARMESDTDRRLVLLTAATTQTMDHRNREAYLAATRSIRSDTERMLALNALVGAGGSAGTGTSTSTSSRGTSSGEISNRGGERVWNTSTHIEIDGRDVTISAHDVVLGRTRGEIARIRPGGSLVVQETRGGTIRRLQATPGADGRPVYTYTVDGRVRGYDSAARDWFAAVMRDFTAA